jgi:hypothetical protein
MKTHKKQAGGMIGAPPPNPVLGAIPPLGALGKARTRKPKGVPSIPKGVPSIPRPPRAPQPSAPAFAGGGVATCGKMKGHGGFAELGI